MCLLIEKVVLTIIVVAIFLFSFVEAEDNPASAISITKSNEISLRGPNSIGSLIMNYPKRRVSVTSEAIVDFTKSNCILEHINESTDSIQYILEEDCIVNSPTDKLNAREAMPPELRLAGGSASLDRLTVINYVFIEGNGDPEYDWIADTVNYLIECTFQTHSLFITEADSYGITLKYRSRSGAVCS